MSTKDSTLKEYYEILQATKQLNKRLEQLRKNILEWGTTATANYVATVEQQRQLRLKGIEEFDARLGRQLLLEMQLLQELNFKVLRVTPKVLPDVSH